MKRKVYTDGNGSKHILIDGLGEYSPKADHDRLAKENAQLKADKAELLAFIQSMPDDIEDIFEWHEANNFFVDELIDKHEE